MPFTKSALTTTLFLLVGFIPVPAEEAESNSAPAAEVEVSYNKAFDQLLELGFPSCEGLQLVKVSLPDDLAYDDKYSIGYLECYSFDESKLFDTEYAWLVSEEDGIGTIRYREFFELDLKRKKQRGALMKFLVGSGNDSGGNHKLADWENAEPSKLVSSMSKQLKSLKSHNLFVARTWEYNDSGAQICARCLAMATAIYSAGYEKEANQLASAIFALASINDKVIDELVNMLAESQYSESYQKYYEDNDLLAFRKSVDLLAETFPRGWKNYYGAQLLSAKIGLGLESTERKIPAHEKFSADPEVLAIIDQLLARTDDISLSAPTGWILPQDPDANESSRNSYGYSSRHSQPQKWASEIIAKRRKALETLILLVDDPTILKARKAADRSNSWSQSYYDDDMPAEDLAMQQYDAMLRPLSVGDVAQSLIKSALPVQSSRGDEISSSALIAYAEQWLDSNHNRSDSEIAVSFLQQENSDFVQAGLTYLCSAEYNESHDKAIQQYFLLGENIDLNLIQKYVSSRKAKASTFVTKLEAELKSRESSDDRSFEYRMKQKGGVDKYIDALKSLMVSKPPAEMLAEIQAGKVSLETGMNHYWAAIESDKSQFNQAEYLKFVVGYQSAEGKIESLDVLIEKCFNLNLIYNPYSDDREQTKNKELSGEERELWRSLMKCHSTLTPSELEKMNGVLHFDTYVAWCVLWFVDGDTALRMMSVANLSSEEESRSMIVGHANHLLGDRADSPVPDPPEEGSDIYNEVTSEVSTMNVDQLITYINTAELSQKMVLDEIMADETKRPESLSSISGSIIKPHAPIWGNFTSEDKKDLERLLVGKVFDQSVLKQMHHWFFERRDRLPNTICVFMKGHGLFGSYTAYLMHGKQAEEYLDSLELDMSDVSGFKQVTAVSARAGEQLFLSVPAGDDEAYDKKLAEMFGDASDEANAQAGSFYIVYQMKSENYDRSSKE